MADAEEVRMLAEITRLYYEEEWTQQRIAKKFNMSRSLVLKLLSKARKLGIVGSLSMTRSFTRTGSWRRSLRNGFRSERQCASVWETVKIR